MSDKRNISKIIYDFTQNIFAVLFSKNLEFSVIRLLFLKYVVDNYVGANSVENMQCCARAQKMFAIKDIENGVDIITPVLQYIDSFYGLQEIISSKENIEEYSCELFGENINRQRKNVVSSDFKKVIDALGSIDLEEKNGSNELGKELVEALIENVISNSYKNAFSGENSTRQSLSMLAGRILDVKSDDCFCDFASGIGLSTIEITKSTMPHIVNSEISNTAVAISAMLYIMYGYKDFSLYSGDSLTQINQQICGNKLFIDGPIAAKLERTEDNEYSDSSLAIISRTFHDYLSDDENALAVITLPPSPLFASYKQAVTLRQKLVENGAVKAVVALPPMWRGTSVGTNLLILSRKPEKQIVFINAAETFGSIRDKTDPAGEKLLPQEIIESIVKEIENPKTVSGFCRVATSEEVQDKEYNLIPASYVEVRVEEDHTTLEEIDNELKELYRQLAMLSP